VVSAIKIGIASALMLLILSSAMLVYYGRFPFTGVPADNARLSNPGYLKIDNGKFVEDTKLYLISAMGFYGVHDGQECFIINASVRNDYKIQNETDITFSSNNGTAVFAVKATLSNMWGKVYASDLTDVRAVPLERPQYSLNSGQTASVIICMSTWNRNIDSYSIDLVYLSGLLAP
jgi:hypothetical protein